MTFRNAWNLVQFHDHFQVQLKFNDLVNAISSTLSANCKQIRKDLSLQLWRGRFRTYASSAASQNQFSGPVGVTFNLFIPPPLGEPLKVLPGKSCWPHKAIPKRVCIISKHYWMQQQLSWHTCAVHIRQSAQQCVLITRVFGIFVKEVTLRKIATSNLYFLWFYIFFDPDFEDYLENICNFL